jgi:hypothetical protein
VTHRERKVDGETERQCSRCGEWLPLDDDFFYRVNGYLRGVCKACWSERRFVGGRRVLTSEGNTSVTHTCHSIYTQT